MREMGIRTQEEFNRQVDFYVDAGIGDDAHKMLAARVHLGTASWRDRLRYHLRLGPSKREMQAAAQHREFRQRLDVWRAQKKPPATEVTRGLTRR